MANQWYIPWIHGPKKLHHVLPGLRGRRKYRYRRINTDFDSRRYYKYLKKLKNDPTKEWYKRDLKEYKTGKGWAGKYMTLGLLRMSPHYRGYSHNILRHFAPREHVRNHKARF